MFFNQQVTKILSIKVRKLQKGRRRVLELLEDTFVPLGNLLGGLYAMRQRFREILSSRGEFVIYIDIWESNRGEG